MNMSVDKQGFFVLVVFFVLFFVRRYLKEGCQKYDLQHVVTEGLIIECIYTVWGANNSKVSKITTSNCMTRTLTHFHISEFQLGIC